jgi:hypothetical protein
MRDVVQISFFGLSKTVTFYPIEPDRHFLPK